MYKIGLKLWSTNKQYIRDAQRLFNAGVYSYIELFAVPETYKESIAWWRDLNIPFIIHAPHFMQGLNFAKRECFTKNKELVAEALRFADALRVDMIIFHPGIDGSIQETVHQIKQFLDQRMLIENKPYYSIDGKMVCNGYSPADISYVLERTGINFCFDMGHAICAANALKINKIDYIKRFLALKPDLFHLSDGDWNGVFDKHKHLGAGNFKLTEIIAFIPRNARVALETPHDENNNLKDFEQEIKIVKTMYEKRKDCCCNN